MRGRGPVSAAIADLTEDRTLDVKGLAERRAQVKAEAHVERASRSFRVVVDGRRVTVSDVHVDEVGALVCTITHRDIPAGANPFRFVNPPVIHDGREDPGEAFAQMVRDVVAAVIR